VNGIKLKSNSISPLRIERIKWILLLLITQFLNLILFSVDPIKVIETEQARSGYLRLTIRLKNHIPSEDYSKDAIIMTSQKKIISREVRIIKRINLENSLNSSEDLFLIELPEKDLSLLISEKDNILFSYPSSSEIKNISQTVRSKNYEIHF
jgi:hypothetical protein